MPYLPAPPPEIPCPACGAPVRVIPRRRGWAGAHLHPEPVGQDCREALRALDARL